MGLKSRLFMEGVGSIAKGRLPAKGAIAWGGVRRNLKLQVVIVQRGLGAVKRRVRKEGKVEKGGRDTG